MGTPRADRRPGGALPLRVLAVSTYPQLGGGEVLLVDLLDALRAHAVDVRLAVLGDGPVAARARARGIPVADAGETSFRHADTVARAAWRVREAARDFAPHVVHGSNPKAQVVTRLGTVGVGVTGFVQSVQLLDPPPPGDRYLRLTRHLGAVRFTITPDATRAWAAALPERRLHLVEPGVDRAALTARAARADSRRVWRDAGVRPSAGPRLVTVARLQRYKGVYDVVATMAQVAATRPDARLLVVGPDEPMEPGAREALRARIADAGLSGRAAVTGPLSDDDLAAVVHDADLLVHAAHVETFGLVLVEAMALGTPVVAYGAAGPRHVLATGGGAVVPVGDVAALASVIDAALTDLVTRARWVCEGERVADHYSIDRMAGEVAAVLRAAVDGGHRRPRRSR